MFTFKSNAFAMLIALAVASAAGPTLPGMAQTREPDQEDREREPINRTRNDGDKPAPPRTRAPSPSQEQPRKPDPSATSPRPNAPTDQGATTSNDEADRFGGRMSPKAAQKKILLEEAKYRNQMARIARLRELATQQGNQERLAALDKLEAKMTELHDRKIAAARAALSYKDREKLNKELEKGRGRGKGAGIGKDKDGDDRPDTSAKDDNGKGKPSDNDRSKPLGATRPDQANPSGKEPSKTESGKDRQSADDRKPGSNKPANAGGGNDSKGAGKGKGKP